MGNITGNTDAQYVASVKAVTSTGQVVQTTPAIDGSFTIANVPVGTATVSCVYNPATVPAGYFTPRPVQVTVATGAPSDTGFMQALYAEPRTGTVTWTINGQQQTATILKCWVSGFPPFRPRFYLWTRSIAGDLTIVTEGITGPATYGASSVGGSDISYYSSPGGDNYRSSYGSGSISLTTYDPGSRHITGTATFVAGGFEVPTGNRTGLSVTGSAQFDLSF